MKKCRAENCALNRPVKGRWSLGIWRDEVRAVRCVWIGADCEAARNVVPITPWLNVKTGQVEGHTASVGDLRRNPMRYIEAAKKRQTDPLEVSQRESPNSC